MVCGRDFVIRDVKRLAVPCCRIAIVIKDARRPRRLLADAFQP